ncbi:MAG: DUF962 domain-containing protein [Proteobacteria bacterium]|nr:DUF962 domain-containing protein [Pseudomonadota bacterium]
MDTLTAAERHLVHYARYHRDPRNIATHFIGIPLIVLSLGVLLAQPELWQGLTPAMVAWAAATLWMVGQGHLPLALATAVINGLLLLAGAVVADWGSPLTWGLALFGVGWVFQFVGHYYEGRKPAFMDDLRGLLVGPMFITAEALFAIGRLLPLKATIETGAGPTRLRDLAAQ